MKKNEINVGNSYFLDGDNDKSVTVTRIGKKKVHFIFVGNEGTRYQGSIIFGSEKLESFREGYQQNIRIDGFIFDEVDTNDV